MRVVLERTTLKLGREIVWHTRRWQKKMSVKKALKEYKRRRDGGGKKEPRTKTAPVTGTRTELTDAPLFVASSKRLSASSSPSDMSTTNHILQPRILVVKVCWHLCLVFRMPMIPWSQSLEGVCQSPDVHPAYFSPLGLTLTQGIPYSVVSQRLIVGH